MIALGIDIGGSSVKAALLSAGTTLALGQSARYQRPDASALLAAMRSAITQVINASGSASEAGQQPRCVGLCAPGLFDPVTRTITRAVNLPGIVGLPLDQLVHGAFSDVVRDVGVPRAVVLSDAHAATLDVVLERGLKGRTLGLAIGTGVGACVLDDTEPLLVSGHSPGHLGQLDVTLNHNDPNTPIGPDGGRGSLEAYVGAAALRARLGAAAESETDFINLDTNDPALLALARALRIAHALYRPQQVVVMGGVGNRLRYYQETLYKHVSGRLTSVAWADWSLSFGDDDHHAARGAARQAIHEHH